jgi:hypothetical protein
MPTLNRLVLKYFPTRLRDRSVEEKELMLLPRWALQLSLQLCLTRNHHQGRYDGVSLVLIFFLWLRLTP